MRQVIRRQHFAYSTEQSYCDWVRRFWGFLKGRPDLRVGVSSSEQRVEAFLTWLAVEGEVSASTQNQAFSALLFLYREVLKTPLQDVDALRAKRPVRVRDSVPRPELLDVLRDVEDTATTPARLITLLLYGAGLRVSEGLNLRIKDVQLRDSRLVIREPKHGHDRVAILPCALASQIADQIDRARLAWKRDLSAGVGVQVPAALNRKYPQLHLRWQWYWLFPAAETCLHPRSGVRVRYRVHEAAIQRALRRASARHGMEGRLTPHVLRHCFGTHFSGDIQVLQKLLGHRQLETTCGYRHPELTGTSPLDDALGLPAAAAAPSRRIYVLTRPERPLPALPVGT